MLFFRSVSLSLSIASSPTHPLKQSHPIPAPRHALTSRHHSSFFKTLVEHEITVELKNEVQIRGTLKSVDQYLNIKLDNAEAVDELKWPHLVRFWSVPGKEVERELEMWIAGEKWERWRCWCWCWLRANTHSAQQKTCLSAAPSCDTSISLLAPSIPLCWKMRRGERLRRRRTRQSEGIAYAMRGEKGNTSET